MSASPAGLSSSFVTRRSTVRPTMILCAAQHGTLHISLLYSSLPATAGSQNELTLDETTIVLWAVKLRKPCTRLLDRTPCSHAGKRLLPVLVPQVQYAQEQLGGWQQGGSDAPAVRFPKWALVPHLRTEG